MKLPQIQAMYFLIKSVRSANSESIFSRLHAQDKHKNRLSLSFLQDVLCVDSLQLFCQVI